MAAILKEVHGHVALLTLNRPEALNAINARLSHELAEAIDAFVNDHSVRAIVLTGAGRAFCAGHDLKALASGEPAGDSAHPQWGYAGLVERKIDKPIIVAAHGYMLGAGLEIALASDLVVATRTLKIGLPEVQRGLIAAAGGVARLAQQLPPHIASWMIYGGQPIDAETGLRWGLINEIVADNELVARALELGAIISANAPLAVQASKRLVRSLSNGSTWTQRSWATMNDEFTSVSRSVDAVEGAAAFAEGRPPLWQGR